MPPINPITRCCPIVLRTRPQSEPSWGNIPAYVVLQPVPVGSDPSIAAACQASITALGVTVAAKVRPSPPP